MPNQQALGPEDDELSLSPIVWTEYWEQLWAWLAVSAWGLVFGGGGEMGTPGQESEGALPPEGRASQRAQCSASSHLKPWALRRWGWGVPWSARTQAPAWTGLDHPTGRLVTCIAVAPQTPHMLLCKLPSHSTRQTLESLLRPKRR